MKVVFIFVEITRVPGYHGKVFDVLVLRKVDTSFLQFIDCLVEVKRAVE
jgi:hypothetical protein